MIRIYIKGVSLHGVGSWFYRLEYKGRYKENLGVLDNVKSNEILVIALQESLKALKRYDIPIKVYTNNDTILKGATNKLDKWEKKVNAKGDGYIKAWQDTVPLIRNFDDIQFEYRDIYDMHYNAHLVGTKMRKAISEYLIQKEKEQELLEPADDEEIQDIWI